MFWSLMPDLHRQLVTIGLFWHFLEIARPNNRDVCYLLHQIGILAPCRRFALPDRLALQGRLF